ncbi:MAG: glycosyl transferase [Flavobacterium sp. BFFFF2]|nr:MAG: glycosyl transferase [Flavobacterium sp. BFFFF2]
MTFCIVTHVPHLQTPDGRWWAYAPYVREMNLWNQTFNKVIVVAPVNIGTPTPLHETYAHPNVELHEVPQISFVSVKSIFRSLFRLPFILRAMRQAFQQSDQLHLRCPGNMGLLGMWGQLGYSAKPKTIKYAGNWIDNQGQPWSYRFQKWMMKQPWLLKNTKVLAYTFQQVNAAHVLPFFTATYREDEIPNASFQRDRSVIQLLFVGTLSAGKRPEWVIETAAELYNKGISVQLNIVGEGVLRSELESMASHFDPEGQWIHFLGAVDRESLKSIYKKSHFLLAPSKSEGWPKVVAEALFWGCIPVVTPVSCLPEMIGQGQRGLFFDKPTQVAEALVTLLREPIQMEKMSHVGQEWAQHYTLNRFEQAIQKVLS